MFYRLKFLILSVSVTLSLVILTVVTENNPTCRDENGNEVDWFFIYKLTRDPQEQYSLNNFGYLYILNGQNNWNRPTQSIDSETSLFGKWLSSFFDDEENVVSYIAYNYNDLREKVPLTNGTWGFDGHSRGILIFSENSGVWILHSIPPFPAKVGNHTLASYLQTSFELEREAYPYEFAQLIVCMSIVPERHVNLIAEDMINVHGSVVDYKLSPKHSRLASEWYTLIKIQNNFKNTNFSPPNFQSMIYHGLILRNWTKLQVFVKPAAYESQIYIDWIGPILGSDLLVQSWSKHSKAESICDQKYSVVNVSKKVIMGTLIDYRDHSKWLIGTKKPWTCISDINNTRKNVRYNYFGGLTICFEDHDLWNAFSNIVHETEPCRSNK